MLANRRCPFLLPISRSLRNDIVGLWLLFPSLRDPVAESIRVDRHDLERHVMADRSACQILTNRAAREPILDCHALAVDQHLATPSTAQERSGRTPEMCLQDIASAAPYDMRTDQLGATRADETSVLRPDLAR